jgi:hypothetical protein
MGGGGVWNGVWRMRDGGGVSGKREKNGKNGQMAAGGGAVGGWEVMGGGGVWWVWIIGSVWRRRTEKEGGGVYGRYRK